MKIFVFLFTLAWTAASCTAGKPDSSPLERALQAAGENREALEKVLAHYAQDPADSLKLKAARFLIENMPGHWGIDSASISGYIAHVDSLPDLPHALRRLLLDVPARYPDSFPQAKRVEDIRIVKAQDLIGQVDWAFQMKDSCPWLEHVGFEIFYEGLLPYRIAHEPLDFSHGKADSALQAIYDYARRHYDDCRQSSYNMSLFIQRSREFQTAYTIPDTTLKQLVSVATQADKIIMVRLRDLGIPATLDYDPIDPLTINKRAWSVPMESRIFTKSYNEITRAGSGKFYRQTYARNPIPEPSDREEHVPAFFRNPFQKDVTDTYLHTADVELPVSLPAGKEYAYLAMYDKEEWVPVAFAKAENGKCRFRNLGVDALYLPVHYPGGEMEALGAPFVLQVSGSLSPVAYQGSTTTLHLDRTAPFSGRYNNPNESFTHSHFICAEDKEFLYPDTVYTVSDFSSYKFQRVTLPPGKKGRYWRLSTNNTYFAYMAELHFKDAQGQLLEGNYYPPSEQPYETLTDEDLETFCTLPKNTNIDFGKSVPVKTIEYVLFYGQGNVLAGHEYELFYFLHGQWHSAGRQKATDYNITFKEVPSGCLYQLVDRTEGIRGDLFTQENGRIRFW